MKRTQRTRYTISLIEFLLLASPVVVQFIGAIHSDMIMQAMPMIRGSVIGLTMSVAIAIYPYRRSH